jgi:hypothetical protein
VSAAKSRAATGDTDVMAVSPANEACVGPDHAKNPHKMGVVLPVLPVSPFPGNGGDHPAPICGQCGAGGDDLRQVYDGVWLHDECIRFYPIPKPDDDLTIPGLLRRDGNGAGS